MLMIPNNFDRATNRIFFHRKDSTCLQNVSQKYTSLLHIFPHLGIPSNDSELFLVLDRIMCKSQVSMILQSCKLLTCLLPLFLLCPFQFLIQKRNVPCFCDCQYGVIHHDQRFLYKSFCILGTIQSIDDQLSHICEYCHDDQSVKLV